MAEPVVVPVKLEVTDIDTSSMDFGDVEKKISSHLSGVKKAIADAFKGVDASAINKPIEKSMGTLAKSVKAEETAILRYRESLVKAGKSTAEYKATVNEANAAIRNQEAFINELSQLGPAVAPHLEEAKKKLNDLIDARNNINPLDFVDKAEPIQIEKVAQALKNVLSVSDNTNKSVENLNQTVKDNSMSDEYVELIAQAEAYRDKLEALDAKSKEMADLGATDKSWDRMRYQTEKTSKELDEVLKKLRDAVKTGKAFRFGDGDKSSLSRQINSVAMSGRNRANNIRNRANTNQSPYTDDYKNALKEFYKYQKDVTKAQERLNKLIADGAPKDALGKLVNQIEGLDIKIDEAKNGLFAMVESGKAFKVGQGNAAQEMDKVRSKANGMQSALTGTANSAKMAQGGLEALSVTNPKLAAILGVVVKIGKGLGVVLSVAGKASKAIATGFGKVAKTLASVASWIGKITSDFFGRKASTSHNSGLKKLTRNIMMFGLGFRTAYYLIKRLRTIFIEGFKAMGEQFDEIGQPMMRLMEAFNRLKGSLATAFQPIVSVLMPILTRFMNYLSGMLEAVGKFTAVLTGQKHIYKAVAKDINSVADSAKDANKQLGSYDKLEVIKNDDNNLGYDYEKQGIGETESAASRFAEMVKAAWEKADFTSVGSYVTTQLVDMLARVANTIVPKAIGFVNKILTSINTFLEGFGATRVGKSVGLIVNKIVELLDWTQLGMLLANLYSETWDFLYGLVSEIDWTLLGQSLYEGLTAFVDNLDFKSLAGLISGLALGIITAAEQIDWAYLANTLLNGIQLVMQTVGEALAGSDNPLVSVFGDAILAINDVITIFRPVVGSLISAISPIVQSILPVISNLLPPIAELIATAAQMVLPVFVALIESVMPIIGNLAEILMPILLDVLKSLQPIFDALTDVVLPVIVHLLDALMPLIGGVLKLVGNLLSPILSLIGPLLEIVFKILDPVITILEPILEIIGILCDVLGEVLRPILDVLTPILDAVSAIFGQLGPLIDLLFMPVKMLADMFKYSAGIIEGSLVPVLKILGWMVEIVADYITMLADRSTASFSGIVDIVNSVRNKLKQPFNAILSMMETLANGIITGLNKATRALNAMSFDVPDWVPVIGGQKFGFNIREIGKVSIPKLAQGAVIPPNREFLAMLGDQKHGTNIEAPLDTIKQALAEVLAEIGGAGNKQPIVLQVNGRTLAQVVWDEQEKRYKQTGKSMA